jgi:hypothetical protein
MTFSNYHNSKHIRLIQYRDLDAVARLVSSCGEIEQYRYSISLQEQIEQVKNWYGLYKFLSLFPNPRQYDFQVYVSEKNNALQGLIQVNPINSTRSTWRVDRVLVDRQSQGEILTGNKSVGSQLLRYCFEKIWEARTWVLEVNINHQITLGLYRQNGFQPLAQKTYWAIAPELLKELAQNKVELPNLLPVSNADAYLLYQLDTVSMPPLLRQVFDRHINDFKTNLVDSGVNQIDSWTQNQEIRQGYVFEPQRKAAIGYFKLNLCQNGSRPHHAKLTVHPAYTWLYPQLLSQMARIVQDYPPQSLELNSADYQPEREEYLGKIGAERVEHTLLMSRSVWHKLRETKPLEALQLSEMLQGLQTAQSPIPSQIAWLRYSSPANYFQPFDSKSSHNNDEDSDIQNN